MVANAMMASAGAVANDKTPDAVNWANIGPGNTPQSNANQTISGIDTTITLEANFTGSVLLSYSKNGGSFTLMTNGGQLNVSNGDTVRWQAENFVPGTTSGTVTITNESDGSTTLDTFTYDVTLPL